MARGRKRTIAGGGLLALSGVLGLAMLASRNREFFVSHRAGCFAGCSRGVVVAGVEWGGHGLRRTEYSESRLSDPHLTWWIGPDPRSKGFTPYGLFGFQSISQSGQMEERAAAIPLWPLILASLVSGGLLRRSGAMARVRALANLCPACRYDRAGLGPDQACPECGQTPPALSTSPPPTP